MPDPRPHGRRRRPQRGIVVGTVAVLVLAAAGIGAYAATNPSGTRYRTAKVATDAVTQTLTETGTAAPETSATASFADNGSVQSVAVQAGQTVTAGQVLAQLNTVTLNATLQAAKATAAQDALVLAAAENGQTLSVDGTGGSSGSTGSSFSTHTSADLFSPGTSAGSATLLATTTSTAVIAAGGRPSSGSGSGTTSTSALQDAVTGEQRALDSDLSDAGRSLAAAEGSCPSAVTVPSSG
ncbi:MAG TPA: biotin/lipoyl-binding protein, partial [Mycobacteriales bacterium]